MLRNAVGLDPLVRSKSTFGFRKKCCVLNQPITANRRLFQTTLQITGAYEVWRITHIRTETIIAAVAFLISKA